MNSTQLTNVCQFQGRKRTKCFSFLLFQALRTVDDCATQERHLDGTTLRRQSLPIRRTKKETAEKKKKLNMSLARFEHATQRGVSVILNIHTKRQSTAPRLH